MVLEIVIVVVTLVGILYWLIRGRRQTQTVKRLDASVGQGRAPSSPEKDDALERFRAVHAKARDNLSKVQEGIEADPHRATKAFRHFMKRE